MAEGVDAEHVAKQLVDELRAPDLECAFVFADWRLDPNVIARVTQRGLSPARVVGGTSVQVIGSRTLSMAAVGLGLYGDWLRVGIGMAPELSKSPLTRSRDAVHTAAMALGLSTETLDPSRHVGITFVDGRSGHEEAFCIGSAAAAPQIRFVGGCAAIDINTPGKTYVWAHGEVMSDAGIVVLLQSALPCYAVTSSHLVPTELKTVVTAASGRNILELDGRPALARLTELVAKLGDTLDRPQPSHCFARYIEGTPYVRSIMGFEGDQLRLASAVEVGHVLRIMRPGDLIGQTRRDLAIAAERVGGTMSALLAFSCMGRHWEAGARGLEKELAETYAAYPTTGFQTLGEQSGMLLVNHTLTGLAIGARKL
ncbi:MAG TPA: FIST N-terminal domain-containing protein [Kofleriaceae bacterium]|nr:FIST N-terminal domain-containing protein [Kofleriaceae bacterium]